jgi:hypothetical protein
MRQTSSSLLILGGLIRLDIVAALDDGDEHFAALETNHLIVSGANHLY